MQGLHGGARRALFLLLLPWVGGLRVEPPGRKLLSERARRLVLPDAAVRRRDHQTIHAGLKDFILPLIAIRNRKKGYAVSIIKAGMKVIGRDSGPVRPPLTDLTEQEIAELAALVAKLPQAATQQAAE